MREHSLDRAARMSSDTKNRGTYGNISYLNKGDRELLRSRVAEAINTLGTLTGYSKEAIEKDVENLGRLLEYIDSKGYTEWLN